MLGIFFESSDL